MNTRNLVLLLLTWVLCTPFFLPAQTSSLIIEEIPIGKGRLKNSVMDLLQDQRGFLWVSTVGGLYRYDGYEFKHYPFPSVPRKEHRDTMWHNAPGAGQLLEDRNGNIWIVNTFSESWIGWLKMLDIRQDTLVNLDIRMVSRPVTYKRPLIEDPEGYLWVHCLDGLRRITLPEEGGTAYEIKLYSSEPGTPHALSDTISSLLLDRRNRLWMSTYDGGLHYYDRQQDQIRKISTLSPGGIWELSQMKNGSIAAASKEGLFLIDPETLQIEHIQHQPGIASSLAGNYIRTMLPDLEGQLWLFSAPRKEGPYTLQRFDPVSGQFSGPYMDSILPGGAMTGFYDAPFHLFADRNGRIWVNNNKGLQFYDPEHDRFVHIRNANPTIGESVHTFLQDNSGVLWMGAPMGLSKFAPGANRFKVFRHQTDNPLSLSGDRVATVFEDSRGYLWLGHSRGIDRIRLNEVNQITEKKFFFFDAAYGFSEDRQGNIWVHSLSGKLGFIATGDQPINVYTSFPVDGRRVNFKIAVTAIRAPEKGIFISSNGLLHHDPVTGTTKHFPLPNSLTTTSGPLFIHGYDSAMQLWLSNSQYFLRFDPSSGEFIPFPTRTRAGRFICQGDKGEMWTTTSGLRLLNIKDGALLKHFHPGTGFPTDFTEGVVKDDHGNLWITSDVGLIQFDPKTEQFRVFDRANGLPTNNIYAGSGCKRQNGELLIPLGEKGLVLFDPTELQPDSFPVPPVITGLKLSNDPLLPGDSRGALRRSIPYTKEIVLAHHQNVLTIEYTGLHFSMPEANRFTYLMEGIDEDWVEAGNRRVATYAGLAPGDYTFRLKAANPDGIWNPSEASLRITIRPPWWRTWWAYSLYALGILTLIATVYRFLLDRQLEQAETRRLAELDEAKTQMYTNITHEFRTPLTVIQGMADQMEENPGDWFREGLRLIRNNSNKLLRLVNQMLDLHKLESGSMPVNIVQGDVVNYLQYITESFRSYAVTKNIRLHFLCPFEKLMMDYDPEKLLTIVSNLLSNAIKFTPEGGDVYVQLAVDSPQRAVGTSQKNGDKLPIGKTLVLIIKDTGIGISEKKRPYIFNRFYQADDNHASNGAGTGIGLALTKELTNLLKGKIEVQSNIGKGSTFIVRLPIFLNAQDEHLVEQITEQVEAFIPGVLKSEINCDAAKISEEQPLVLLVEDNEDVLLYLQSCLAADYQLAFARNGREGIDRALELVPDVVLSDVMMPEVGGFELCDTLKKDVRTSHIPIILLTAKADQASKVEGLKEGADAYLTKPFDKEELQVRLKKLIELRRHLLERYDEEARTARFLKPGSSSAYPREDAFLQQIQDTLVAHIDEQDFGIPELCAALGMSRTQLHRKIKALTGKSTSIYLRSLRLAKARELLENSDLNVSEVSYEVGFRSPTYFSQAFSEEYGVPPSAVKKG